MATCIRAQCRRTATVGLAIDSPGGVVWLIDWPADGVRLSPMCSHHADALTVPGGWLLHDNRGDTKPALFADRSVAKAKPLATVFRRDQRPVKREVVAEAQTPFNDAFGAEPDAEEASPENSAKANPSRKLIDEPEDRHSEMLEVDDSTPLLKRAFRSSQAG